MKHLGDITKISGYDAPIVDVVVGGSPCQDLSVAGKRAGLSGERSGLFMEQIRIIKEMRKRSERGVRADVDIRPRYMVWENVPGAFSSNGGEDFRVVLEEIAKVKDENASIPRPSDGKWTNAGCIVADGWSVAWKVFDAQFWGVPQRRRRIALVADFGGESASEILFVRESMRGHTDQSRKEGKEAAGDVEAGTSSNDSERKCYAGTFGAMIRFNNQLEEDITPTLTTAGGDNQMSVVIEEAKPSMSFQERAGKEGGGKGILIQDDRTGALSTLQNQYVVAVDAVSIENHPNDSRVKFSKDGKVQTLSGRMGTGGGNVPLVMVYRKQAHPRSAQEGQGWEEADKSDTLNVFDNAETRTPTVVVEMDRASYNQGKNAQFDIGISEDGVAHTVIAKGPGAVAYAMQGLGHYEKSDVASAMKQRDYKDATDLVVAVDLTNETESEVNGTLQASAEHNIRSNNVVRINYIVRRLTPLECERLQGYPDYWTDIGEFTNTAGKKCKSSDAVRYKALGNSIALPSWKWVLKRISAQYERNATMASLFDGIGGFPLLWEQINGKGSCLWASEIEEFPIGVTKERIGE